MPLRFANLGWIGVCALVLGLGGCVGDQGDEGETGSVASAHDICGRVALHGIDVSRHNGAVDWPTVRRTNQFAFARVSDGLTTPDPLFSQNWRGMKDAGLIRGAYQFFRPRRDPIDQANLMLRMLRDAGGLKAGDLPPVLDLEATDDKSNEEVVSKAQAWLDHMESKTGVKPIVYTGNHMTQVIGGNFSDYVLWLAHYTQPCPRVPTAWGGWTFWQFTESGSVDGVNGNVDQNHFRGNRAAINEITLKRAVRTFEPAELLGSTSQALTSLGESDGDAAMGSVLRAASR